MSQEGEVIQHIDPITGQPIILEYSVSRGWQPVDLGTLSGNLNYSQDLLGTGMDPAAGVLSGNYDQSQYAPVQINAPEQPSTPTIGLWANSGDELKSLWVTRLQEGAMPYEIIQESIAGGHLPDPLTDENPEAAQAQIDAVTADLTNARQEVYETQQYETAMQNPEYAPNPNSQRFTNAGLPDPSQQYTDEELNPLLPFALEKGAQGLDQVDDYNQWASRGAVEHQIRRQAEKYSMPDSNTAGEPREDGWYNVGEEGSRLERLGGALYGSANELADLDLSGLAEDPNSWLAKKAGGAVNSLVGWATDRPEEEGEPESGSLSGLWGSNGRIADIIRHNAYGGLDRATGGDGHGGGRQASGGRTPGMRSEQYYQQKTQESRDRGNSAYDGWMDAVKARRSQNATNRLRQQVGTPTQNALRARMGL